MIGSRRSPKRGGHVFTRADADAVTDASAAAIKMTLYRQKKRGTIEQPQRRSAPRIFMYDDLEWTTSGATLSDKAAQVWTLARGRLLDPAE